MFGRDPPDEDMFQSPHPESHEIEDNHGGDYLVQKYLQKVKKEAENEQVCKKINE